MFYKEMYNQVMDTIDEIYDWRDYEVNIDAFLRLLVCFHYLFSIHGITFTFSPFIFIV